REMSEALFARTDRLQALLTAVEKKTVLAAHLEPVRLIRLRKHPNRALRQRAIELLAGQVAPERRKVGDSYRAALDRKSDDARGKGGFNEGCAPCQKLDGVGVQVGADLLSALRNKSPEQLLIDILDPSREVDPRYLSYQVTTRRGQVLTGLIAAETASSL